MDVFELSLRHVRRDAWPGKFLEGSVAGQVPGRAQLFYSVRAVAGAAVCTGVGYVVLVLPRSKKLPRSRRCLGISIGI